MAGNSTPGYPYGLESQSRWITPTDAYHVRPPQSGHSSLVSSPGPTTLAARRSPVPPSAQDSRQNTLVYTIERRAASRDRSQFTVPPLFPGSQTRSSLSPAAGTFAQRLYASAVPKSKLPSLQTQNAARVEGLAAPPRSADRHVVNQRRVYTDLGITPADQQLEALGRDFGSKAFLISSPSSLAGNEEWDKRPGNSDEKSQVPSYTATFTSSPALANSHDHAVPGLVDETPRCEAPASSSTIAAGRANDVPQGPGTPADYSDVIQLSSASPVSNTPPSLDPLPADPEDVVEEVPPYTLVDETPPPPDLNDADTGARESSVLLDTPAVEDPLPAVPSYTPADSLPVNPPDHRQRVRSPASSITRGTTWQVREVSSDLSRKERSSRLSAISSRSSSNLNNEFAADLYGHPYGRHSIRERARSTSTHANSIFAPHSLTFPPPTATDEMRTMHRAGAAGISPTISAQVTPPPLPSNSMSTNRFSVRSHGDGSSWHQFPLSDPSAMQAYPINTAGMLRRPSTGDSTLQLLPPHSSFSSPPSSPVSSHPAPIHPLYPAPQQPPRKLQRPPPVPNRLRRPSTAPYSHSSSGHGSQM
ncbi:hypothetical protein EV401DRAFT_2064558 [Pisolithus croceorrhizus]|nr:hypothetical protein EV401DRAFT_2064558 [Pisolithus croceorrhizus]